MTETTTAAALEEEAKLWITQVAVAAHQRSPARTKVAVEALETAIDAMAKDAARYRWLRDEMSPATVMVDHVDEGLAGEEMDAAIDAALSLHQTDTKEQQHG